MAPFTQLALSWLRLYGSITDENTQTRVEGTRKSVAIVGAGTAGLSALKALLDLPVETRVDWDIVLYEKRWDVGGVWVPDPRNITPPELPDSPMYSSVHTNTPHPMMTYPHTNFIFPPETPILPSHEFVRDYLQGFTTHFNLRPYMHFNHTILSASWAGDASEGHWSLLINSTDTGSVQHRTFDHLIVGTGLENFPHSPDIPGLQGWLEAKPRKREIIHSVYYRTPEVYAGKNVLIIGGGASGWDMATQISAVANVTYHSTKPTSFLPPNSTVPGTVTKPQVLSVDSSSIRFVDGSSITDVDTVLLGIGYDLKVPFLTEGGVLGILPVAGAPKEVDGNHLSTNFRYIRPLHNHVLSMSSKHPLGALYFIGLPQLSYSASTCMAQSIFAAHTIAKPALLNTHNDTLLSQHKSRQVYWNMLLDRENNFRSRGLDPFYEGHRFSHTVEEGQDYEDNMIEWLKERGVTGLPEGPYVEAWRRRARVDHFPITLAWQKIEVMGETEKRKWLKGVRTEDQWVVVLDKLALWSKETGLMENVTSALRLGFI